MEHVLKALPVSERRVCGVIGQPLATQHYRATAPDDEVGLTAAIISYATRYGRYGYRRILALLWDDGWVVNHKRMERIWKQEGLKVPQKQPQRGRLWLSDGSCVRLRPNKPWARVSYSISLPIKSVSYVNSLNILLFTPSTIPNRAR